MNELIRPSVEGITQALLSVDYLSLKRSFDVSGLPAPRFAEEFLVPVLDSVGERWQKGDLSLSQVYMSGRMCEQLMDQYVRGSKEELKEHGIGIAVLEDFHLLGKRIVCSVLHAAGFGFVDYGPASLNALVEKVQKDNIRILLVSTLMLSSALRVKLLRQMLAERSLEVTILVGGAPFRFDPALWQEVGAHGTSPTASGVIALLNSLTGEVNHGVA